MDRTINHIFITIFILVLPYLGQSQSVFNKAFDESNNANHTSNALELNDSYYFTQKTFKNNGAHIEAVKLDSLGGLISKNDVVSNFSLNLFDGSPGSLQYLSNNEFCQLYHVALDSAVDLVFFDTNFVVKRRKRFEFNYFVNAAVISQINDTTILTLGRIQNSSTFDLYLINSDLQGNERWRTIFGEPGKDDYGFAIEKYNSKIIVSGSTINGGAHLYEFNQYGAIVIDTIYSDIYIGRVIHSHKDFGLYFLVEHTNSSTLKNHSGIVKLNSEYEIEWQRDYFSDEDSYFQQFTIRDDGVLTFAGGIYRQTDLAGLFFQTNHLGDSLGSKLLEHIPDERAQFHDIRPTSDGGYILAGETRAPTQDSWIVKVNAWGCDNIPCIVSVDETVEQTSSLSCFPNPTRSSGTISGSLSALNPSTELKVYNALGQVVFVTSITQSEFSYEMNFPSMGMYLVVLTHGGEVIERKKWVVR